MTTITVEALAIIGKLNNPLFVHCKEPLKYPELKYHFVSHTSLDLIEEKGI